MIAATCAVCTPSPPRISAPKPSGPARTYRSAGAVDARPYATKHYAVVRTHTRDARNKCGLENVTENTHFVHIDGTPFLWVVEEILKRGTNLKTLQVIPSLLRKLREGSHLKILRERGVEVVGGHHKPEAAWGDRVLITEQYVAQRKFMLSLEGDQRALFDEILAMGFDGGKMAERYYCLSGQEYVPLYVVAEEFGYDVANEHHVSAWNLAVIRYLDPTFETGDGSIGKAETLRVKVERLRPLLKSAAVREERLRAIGVERLPEGLSWSRFDEYAALLTARRDGRFEALMNDAPRAAEVLALRFGLDDPQCLTLGEVGKRIGGVSRERARQLEVQGLERLGIASE